MVHFKNTSLSSEDAFWVMWYFLKEHYELSGGKFDISDILSASQPMEFTVAGHIDGQVLRDRIIAPADGGMVNFWNDAVEEFQKAGVPKPERLKQ